MSQIRPFKPSVIILNVAMPSVIMLNVEVPNAALDANVNRHFSVFNWCHWVLTCLSCEASPHAINVQWRHELFPNEVIPNVIFPNPEKRKNPENVKIPKT